MSLRISIPFPLQAGALGAAAGLVLWLSAGNRVELNIDEGIYLEGARRVAAGQWPYRDFFVLTGPGSFWSLGGIFALLGVSLEAARAWMCILHGVMVSCVALLTRDRIGAGAALTAGATLLGFLLLNPNLFTVNHRLESAVLALAGITLLATTPAPVSTGRSLLAGLLLGWAALVTPPVALAAAAAAVWCVRWSRPSTVPLMVGVALPLIGAVIALAAAGGFAPAWHQVTGAAGGYNEANRIAFGATTGGYGPLVQDADGIALAFRCLLVAVLALPAWSAITMLPTAVLLVRRSPEDRVRMVLLSLSGVALVASAYPRWDLTHLGYVSAIPFALLAMGLRSVLPARAFRAVCAAGLVLALVPLAAFLEKGGRRDVETAIGKLSATPQDAALLEELARHVGLRATGWIYPYQPALGFYLGLENPTPYSFLQPGMARPEDERLAAEALERTQPPLLIRVEAPAHAYLRIWPAANLEAIQLPQLDAFVNSRYRSVAVLPHPAGPFRILALSPPATTVRGPAR